MFSGCQTQVPVRPLEGGKTGLSTALITMKINIYLKQEVTPLKFISNRYAISICLTLICCMSPMHRVEDLAQHGMNIVYSMS